MPIRSSTGPAYAENVTPYVVTISNGGGAKTDAAIGPAVSGSQRLLVYQISTKSASRTANNVLCRAGFGASILPAPSANGAAGMLVDGDLAPGAEAFGNPGMGAAGEELRLTCDEPAGAEGKLWVTFYCELIDA